MKGREMKREEGKEKEKKEDKELTNNRCYSVWYSILLCNIALCDTVYCTKCNVVLHHVVLFKDLFKLSRKGYKKRE